MDKIIFPIQYQDLSPHAQIGITVYDLTKPHEQSLVAGTTVDLFDSKLRLRQGHHALRLWKGAAPDLGLSTRTPGLPGEDEDCRQINTLLSRVDKYQPNREWLDSSVADGIHQKMFELYLKSTEAYFEVEFPSFGCTVLYGDTPYSQRVIDRYIFPPPLVKPDRQIEGPQAFQKLIKFYDPLIMRKNDFLARQNPMTEKYYILTRDIDESIVKDLRPNHQELQVINEAIDQPDFMPLSVEAKAKFWRFRYSLKENKRAIVKFLLSVDWQKPEEKEEAHKLLKQWC